MDNERREIAIDAARKFLNKRTALLGPSQVSVAEQAVMAAVLANSAGLYDIADTLVKTAAILKEVE